MAERSAVARLLRQNGYTIRVQGSSTSDIVLPATRGGSLAFVLHAGLPTSQLAERAAKASRAARRCTVLWSRTEDSTDNIIEEFQAECPSGVDVLLCESCEQAVEYMLSCAQRMAMNTERTAVEEAYPDRELDMERAIAHLAAAWNADVHSVRFMLAARPLNELARVTSEEEWQQLLLETDGLIDAKLLHDAVKWLNCDQKQL